MEGMTGVGRYLSDEAPAANSAFAETAKSLPAWECGMRVLVTGHRGYLGSVLVSILHHARFDVVGLDCDLYEGCDFGRIRNRIPEFETDLRDLEFTDLLSFDAVVHLADLPQHPSNRNSTPSPDEPNVEAVVRLAECCKQAKVTRLLLASSCAVYGRAQGRRLNEEGPVHPLTTHAATKLRCEQELARLADRSFAPVILRNPIAYGVSPRLRLDLLVNDFVAAAVTTGQITLQTGGRVWRPLLHVEDIARVYSAVLSAPDECVQNQVFNVVDPDQNYQLAGIADAVCEHVPDCAWRASAKEFDDASYQVDGQKLRKVFPALSFHWDLRLGIRQLRTAMIGAGLTYTDWRSDRFRRKARLNTLLERGQLTAEMRRSQPILPLRRSPDAPKRQRCAFRTAYDKRHGETSPAIGA